MRNRTDSQKRRRPIPFSKMKHHFFYKVLECSSSYAFFSVSLKCFVDFISRVESKQPLRLFPTSKSLKLISSVKVGAALKQNPRGK
jgi:hypothetical protein